MAEWQEDGGILLADGRSIYGDEAVVVADFQELADLLLAPLLENVQQTRGIAPTQGPQFISGGGGRQGPTGPRGEIGPPGPAGPPGPGGGWVDAGSVVRLETASDQVVIGAAAPFGTEKLLVIGDVRIDGGVQLLGAGPLFFESGDSAGADVSGPSTGRIRYNDTTGTWQVSTQGSPYVDIATGATPGNTLNQAYNQGGAGAGRVITADAGPVTINNAVGDASNAFLVTRTVGTGAAITVGVPAVWRVFGDGDTVIGAAAMAGGERLRVVGDARIEGKLTVTGALDPTSLLLSGGTSLFIESNDGSTAPVSGASTGRIRYNNGTGTFQVSVQGGAYADIAIAGGVSPWTTTAGVIHPVVLGDQVSIGSAAGGAKLAVFGDTAGEIGLFVRGAVGQTAALAEWQNSAGTPLVRVNAAGEIVPGADNSGSVGTTGARFALIRGVTVTSGDHVFENEDGSAKWRMYEEPDRMMIENMNTGKKYRLMLEEVA